MVKPARAQRAFTLIELLVVLAIVALMLSIAMPRYLGALDKAKEVALGENLRAVRAAIDRFNADRGRWPEGLDELVGSRYLSAVPVDPMTESSQTWVLVPAEAGGGLSDLHSAAPGKDRAGRPYASY